MNATHAALHHTAVAAVQTRRKAEFALISVLHEIQEVGAYRTWRADMRGYVTEVLGLEATEARKLLTLGARLRALPVLRAAVEDGTLPWTKAREVSRVATPETDADWTDRARSLTSRELEREVTRCRPGDLPPDGDADGKLDPEWVTFSVQVRTTDLLAIRAAMAQARAEAGCDDPDRLEDGAVLAAVARSAVFGRPDHDHAVSEERCRIVLSECPSCRQTAHVGAGGLGERVVSDAVLSRCHCDAEVMEADTGRIAREIPPTTRRLAFHRDEYTCAVPGCSRWIWLDVHHIVPRAAGGDHDLENLACLCDLHHDAVHTGALTLERALHGGLSADWRPAAAHPDGAGIELLRVVLDLHEVDVDEAAKLLFCRRSEALETLLWLERRGEVVRTTDGRWTRLAAPTWAESGG